MPRQRLATLIGSILVFLLLAGGGVYAANFGEYLAAQWFAVAAAAALCVAAAAMIPGQSVVRSLLVVGAVIAGCLMLGYGLGLLNLFERPAPETMADAAQTTVRTVAGYGLFIAAIAVLFTAVFNTNTAVSAIANPLLRPLSLLLAALALCIGWGIRGNFGHEYGAMIPGALTGIAVALCSGREDWRRRAAFFGLLGGLGWGFGGSVSYMHSVAYSDSGQWETLLYGNFLCFFYGFLWAAPGVAGTAMAAAWDRDRLVEFLKPLLWLIGFYVVLDAVYFYLESLEALDLALSRHEGAFYWFDSDWLEALFAILAMWAFDLWDRRNDGRNPGAGVGGFLAGFAGFAGLAAGAFAFGLAGMLALLPIAAFTFYVPIGGGQTIATWLGDVFVRKVGVEPAPVDTLIAWAGKLFDFPVTPYPTAEAFAAGGGPAVLNFPQMFDGLSAHPGTYFAIYGCLGLFIGMAVYFTLFGRFSKGSSLILHMAIGWFAVFLLCPVFMGIRATPPRGDNWAGVLGVFLGLYVYFVRYHWKQVAYASIIGGAIGGLGLSGIVWFRKFLLMPGHRGIDGAGPISDGWLHYQQQNWHSWFEQSYGFVNGLAVIIPLALLATRLAKHDLARRIPQWATGLAAGAILLGFGYVNMVKNPPEWVKQGEVPATMAMPLVRQFEFGATTWFNLIYIVIVIAVFRLMYVHTKRPLDVVPATSVGKGQLLFIAFLWAMCVMNLERALPNFTATRILTEGVIFLNAVLATYLILVLPRRDEEIAVDAPVPSAQWRLWAAWTFAIATCAASTYGHAATTYGFYQPRTLSPEHFAEVIAKPEADSAQGIRDRAILDLYYNYPVASVEIAALPLSAYDAAAGVLTREGAEPIVLAPETRERIDAWLASRTVINTPEEGLFVTVQGKPIGAWGVWSAVRSYPLPEDLLAVPRGGKRQTRFGDEAEWLVAPLRKGEQHN